MQFIVDHCPKLRCVNFDGIDGFGDAEIALFAQRFGKQLTGFAFDGQDINAATVSLVGDCCRNLRELEYVASHGRRLHPRDKYPVRCDARASLPHTWARR